MCNFYQPFPTQALIFTCLLYKSFEKTMGKREIAHNKQFLTTNFSFSQCVFCQIEELSAIPFRFKIVIYKLFQFGSLNFSRLGKG